MAPICPVVWGREDPSDFMGEATVGLEAPVASTKCDKMPTIVRYIKMLTLEVDSNGPAASSAREAAQRRRRRKPLGLVSIVAASIALAADGLAQAPSVLIDALAECQREERPNAPRLAACTEVIDAAAANDEMRAEAYVNRATLHRAALRSEQAIEDLTRAIALNPEYAAPYALRGEIRAASGELDQALADFDSAHRLDADNADVLVARGLVQIRRKAPDRAAEDFKAALALDPDHAGAAEASRSLERR